MDISHILFSVTICLLLVIDPVYSLSACDDVDVNFLIDIDSIKNKGEDIEQLIKSIIWDGSSEYSAFSVVLYGENIPNSIENVKVIELDDNVNINQRGDEEQRIIAQLDIVFNEISQNANTANTKTVSLRNAFNMVNEQHHPVRTHKKRELLSGYHVALFDDENAFIIFDYENKLLSPENNDDLCFLLDHNEKTNEETIHFLLGQSYDEISVNCPQDHQIYANTFFDLSELFSDRRKKEQLLDITCPAYVISPEGFVNLGNHVQWIDVNTIMDCNLERIPAGPETPLQLNSETSYILAKDYTTDDNTFKQYDYLLAFPEIQADLNAMGCMLPIYKIKNIEKVGHNTEDNYDIIKLYVALPKEPMEYMYDADAGTGTHDDKQHTGPRNRGRDQQRSKRVRRLGVIEFFEDIGEGLSDAWDYVTGLEWAELDTGNLKTTLIDITFGNEWIKSKTGTAKYEWTGSGGKPKFTMTGTATMTLKAGFSVNVGIRLYFYFYWHALYDEVYLWVSVEPYYNLDIWFTAEFTGQVTVDIEKLIEWSKYFAFTLGPVPVLIKPFITLSAQLITVPIRVKTGIICHYGEEIEVGYEYQNYYSDEPGYESPISRKVYKRWTDESANTCTKIFEIGSEEENQEPCPAMQLGFDITVTLKSGANLYSAITAYGKLVLALPFRITVPQMDNAICGGAASTSCDAGNSLQVSFTIGPMLLKIYIGVEFEFSLLQDLLNIILEVVGEPNDVTLKQNVAEALVATIQIMEQKTLGCMSLDGVLSFLNSYYKPKCCPGSGGGPSLTCNSYVTGSLSSYEVKPYTFLNDEAKTVVFSNCHASFDTQMRVYDSSNNEITSSSDNYCDADDCDYDAAFQCDTSYRETIRYTNLAAGTYTVKIKGYSSNSGNYRIDTGCGQLLCNSNVQGYLSPGEIITHHFTNDANRRVVFTNCDTSSDTTMSVFDSNGNDITYSSDNNCDGDDCSDGSVSCSYSLKETIVYGSLAPGTYTIKIKFYSSYTSGNYEIDAICGVGSASYYHFDLDRFAPSLTSVQIFGINGAYLAILLVLAIIIATAACCIKNRNCMFNKRNKYKVVSMVDSSTECEEVKVPIKGNEV
eukprot:322394_1